MTTCLKLVLASLDVLQQSGKIEERLKERLEKRVEKRNTEVENLPLCDLPH